MPCAVTICPARDPVRARQVTAALWLVSISVGFGLLSGTVSVTTGLNGHSPSVLAIGLGVLADVTGSATLIWRFALERRQLGRSPAAENPRRHRGGHRPGHPSAMIIAQSAAALATASRPGTSNLALMAAGLSLVVLTPLALYRSLGWWWADPAAAAIVAAIAAAEPGAPRPGCARAP